MKLTDGRIAALRKQFKKGTIIYYRVCGRTKAGRLRIAYMCVDAKRIIHSCNHVMRNFYRYDKWGNILATYEESPIQMLSLKLHGNCFALKVQRV